ncbi:MAG: hypothetical protein DRI69_11150 [Bacteroidetes bacterium]|nr:MAG: hypothetical protein DRI69_11150 [Bacteroidota bacterium]
MRFRRDQKGILYKNNLWLGIAIGLCLPVIAYGILLTVVDFADDYLLPPDIFISAGFKDRTLSVFAICANLIPFHLYKKRYADDTMRGMVFPTVFFVGLWFWVYGRELVGF